MYQRPKRQVNHNNQKGDHCSRGFYEKVVKFYADKLLAFSGLIFFSPLFILIGVIIYIDNPGPIFFSQTRVGKGGDFFVLHKFRTMRMDSPHNVPTHQLANPEKYITRIGKLLRKTSLDELPQLWDIFRGHMSIIGPRPALWNQRDLIEERERYGANDIYPGLTGLAQTNGRDELDIIKKAALDGEYTKILKMGGKKAAVQDIQCFFRTIESVIKKDGIIEGKGYPNVHEEEYDDYGYKKKFNIKKNSRKRVLITGERSYIGEAFRKYINEHYPNISVDTVDMMDNSWRKTCFEGYDTVFHVAGIAHADISHISEEEKRQYYAVNTELAIETAKVAKGAGVNQFIFMSSMIIYGDSIYKKRKVIDEYTVPDPTNLYGDSKWRADKGVRKLQEDGFRVAVLRIPMVYGKGEKGNYTKLVELAKSLPVFPQVTNSRSMIYIDNLCEFVSLLVLSGEGGIYFPQNEEYSNTSKIVKMNAEIYGRHIRMTKIFNPALFWGSKLPGRIGGYINKAFGNNVYSQKLSVYDGMEYQVVDLRRSIILAMKEELVEQKPKVLILSSVASMIDQFNRANIEILLSLGYDVEIGCNFIKGNTCSDKKIAEMKRELLSSGVCCTQIDFTRGVTEIKQNMTAYWQVRSKCKKNNYAFIHCHSPIGGVIGRLIAKQTRTRVIYTAHGFHFFNGAPLKNWIIYYPFERLLSSWTDILITINIEDYKFAKKRLHAKKTVYIPGIGIDIEKYRRNLTDRVEKRNEFKLKDKDIMLLSVGELNKNKNHKVIIKALERLIKDNPEYTGSLHYFIAGKGELRNKLLTLARRLKVNLHLLGFREDIPEILNAADIFLLPSKREGLNVSLMEAMASELPCVVSDIRGNRDLIESGKGGYRVQCNSVEEWSIAIERMFLDQNSDYGRYNAEKIKKFSEQEVDRRMSIVYQECQRN